MRNWTKNKITIHWIRHGQTQSNGTQRYLGITDESLSPEGICELKKNKQVFFVDKSIKVFSSPMKRCLQTAELLFPDAEVQTVEAFKEMDFGDFEGKNYMELREDPRYQAWIDSGGTLPFPNGESREAYIERCVQGFYEMLENIGDETQIVCVVHGGTIMALFYHFCGGDYFDHQVKNGQGYRCVYDGHFHDVEKWPQKSIHGGDIYDRSIKMDFSVNVNPRPMPKSIKEALNKAMDHYQEYPDIICRDLKKAVAKMLGCVSDALIFGNGASELFMAIVHGLKPEKIAIPVPSFYGYEHAAKAVDSEIVYMEYDGIVLDASIDLLFIANPNNPTGKRMDGTTLKALLQECEEKDIYVVLDECFIEFCGMEYSMLGQMDTYRHLMIVRAFTKIFSIPGVRLGYLITKNPYLRQSIEKHLPEWNISTFAQYAGRACAGEIRFISETCEILRQEREFLIQELETFGLKVFPSETNFILIWSEIPLYDLLIDRGILIRDCSNYRGLGEGYYRIAVKTREENMGLLKELGECIEAY